MESYAAARAAERISDRLLDELKSNLAKSAELVEKVRKSGKDTASSAIAKKFHELDLSFHMTLIEASRNRRMLKVVGDSHILTRIFQADRHEFELSILDITQAEHVKIANAVAAKDSEAASTAMQRHIRNSLDLTLTEADADVSDRWWAN